MALDLKNIGFGKELPGSKYNDERQTKVFTSKNVEKKLFLPPATKELRHNLQHHRYKVLVGGGGPLENNRASLPVR